MTALVKPDFLSIEDYLVGEEVSDIKHEYLGGAVHAMAGATNRHNTIAGNAFAALHAALSGKTCQPFNSDTKVRIRFRDHTRFYYPDAMVICRPNPDEDHFQDEPVVVVEVLSESTRRADLVEKRDAYLTLPSLRVLLFIDSEALSVMVLRTAPTGGYATEHFEQLSDIVFLPEIEAKLSLSELYSRTPLVG